MIDTKDLEIRTRNNLWLILKAYYNQYDECISTDNKRISELVVARACRSYILARVEDLPVFFGMNGLKGYDLDNEGGDYFSNFILEALELRENSKLDKSCHWLEVYDKLILECCKRYLSNVISGWRMYEPEFMEASESLQDLFINADFLEDIDGTSTLDSITINYETGTVEDCDWFILNT